MSFAAQYVLMSTDMQTYSTEDQKIAIALYAAKNGFQIVKTYADEGRSGLDLKGREGLRRLIDDVQAGEPGFEAILVYDVSRWGRFQDVDESAYYEFLCAVTKKELVAVGINLRVSFLTISFPGAVRANRQDFGKTDLTAPPRPPGGTSFGHQIEVRPGPCPMFHSVRKLHALNCRPRSLNYAPRRLQKGF